MHFIRNVFLVVVAIVLGAATAVPTAWAAPTGATGERRVINRVAFEGNNRLKSDQLSGIVLLVAMIGAIVLTLRQRPSVKRQDIAQQTGRKRKDAVELKDVRPGQGI